MPEERTGIVTMLGNPVTLVGPEIRAGAQAPAFSAIGKDMAPVNLSDSNGKVRVVASVPSLDTGVCAEETIRLNRLASDHPDNVEVITVSMDLPFALGRFCGANDINNARTLSDHRTAAFGEAYGVLMKENRLLCRAVFVVDGGGSVTHAQYVPEIREHPDYDAVAAAVEGLL